jgi:hypothetical protein
VLQIFESFTNTCMKFAGDNLQWVTVAILAFITVGIILKALARTSK